MRILTMAAFGALAFWAALDAAQAAPLGIGASRATAEASNATETIATRRCWWRQGVRYCRRYRSAYYPYQPYSSGSPIGIIIGIR
jgi:hypothetical protein